MEKIVVLKGGTSPEREVSLVSGAEIASALRNMDYSVIEIDPADYPKLSDLLTAIQNEQPLLVFNGLHGGSGENGELQAALSLAGIKFTGSGFKASCFSMDKYISKLIALAEGIPVPQYILMREDLLEDYQDVEDYSGFSNQLGLPIIVKPNDAGSSVGISRVECLEDLKPAVQKALQYSHSVLLEEYIPGRELTVTIIDSEAYPVVEIKPLEGWYDYTNKYTHGKTKYEAPAQIDDTVAKLLQLYALRLWKAFGLSGYARIDFRYDGLKPYFLEVNTLPGMTSLSLTPMAAKAAGMSFQELLQKIIYIADKEGR
ncbi:MAG: D-alanine--D-alanine ligase [Candidatus Cloacimonadota bacterium]|jgi:D-alanine-D-alanine ligase|nr:D-alanine--D-alanine ligase [Candidatus Cloacimonadota bacterium]HNZ89398.1 D-alanine--D-alanine ligase [Candidatus Cloacimonas acidaminovorans]NLM90598.1 D-alanine--D-alanine ligase [Candidatus Cloacimonadota bacterium]HOI01226.1 D-alanine--D-alanine ligase [Candidatus Cloacimonas acidaminovorans]HPI42183.1 D-alanine--D-alanine ligase [Candidatus Cloacimonas acidaminovorans]